jgi:hypothetical protein
LGLSVGIIEMCRVAPKKEKNNPTGREKQSACLQQSIQWHIMSIIRTVIYIPLILESNKYEMLSTRLIIVTFFFIIIILKRENVDMGI